MVTITKDELTAAVRKCSVAAKKNNHIKINVSNNKMELSADNGILGVATSAKATSDEVYTIVVNYDVFSSFIMRVSGDIIRFDYINGVLVLASNSIEAEFPTLREDFVNERHLSDVRNVTKVNLSTIKMCSHALEPNKNDYRKSSYYIQFSKNGYNITALDGNRVSFRNMMKDKTEFEAIVSGKELDDIVGMISSDKEVTVKYGNESFLEIETDRDVFTVSTYAGKYYNISSLLTPPKYMVSVDTANMIEQLDVIKLFDDLAIFTIEKGIMDITSKTQNGRCNTKVDYQSGINFSLRIGLNANYLTDALKSVREENIKIGFSDKYSPVIITNDNDEYEIIMPIHIGD
jgi:DNA polymerase III sliding clamp (beta) subunit (PCNA family)